jgi:hypothetical protein
MTLSVNRAGGGGLAVGLASWLLALVLDRVINSMDRITALFKNLFDWPLRRQLWVDIVAKLVGGQA